jgi:membrane-bound lytic murein transglycosylase C
MKRLPTQSAGVLFTCTALLLVSPLQASDPFAEMDQSFENLDQSHPDSVEAKSDFDQFKAQEQAEFNEYRERLEREFEEFKKIYAEETQRYVNELRTVWKDPIVSDNKVWVEYSNDMRERSAVDFEKQTITLSITDGELAQQELANRLRELLKKDKAQAFKDDTISQAIEKRSREEITTLETAEVQPAPVLAPVIAGKPSLSDAEIDELVERMIEQERRSTDKSADGKTVVTVEVPFAEEKIAQERPAKDIIGPLQSPREEQRYEPPKPKVVADLRVNKMPKAARALESDVSRYAKEANIDTALVFAVIETESAFNPMAKSPVPAYGLMQIVPSSAGQDATARIFGKPRILSPSYLYNSENNIQVGTTYLNILYYNYLKGIRNEESRLYCAIAAYNTGAGNVAKAFTGKMRLNDAVEKINSMTPQQVYDHLVAELPHDETRQYLVKVHSRIPKYRAEG